MVWVFWVFCWGGIGERMGILIFLSVSGVVVVQVEVYIGGWGIKFSVFYQYLVVFWVVVESRVSSRQVMVWVGVLGSLGYYQIFRVCGVSGFRFSFESQVYGIIEIKVFSYGQLYTIIQVFFVWFQKDYMFVDVGFAVGCIRWRGVEYRGMCIQFLEWVGCFGLAAVVVVVGAMVVVAVVRVGWCKQVEQYEYQVYGIVQQRGEVCVESFRFRVWEVYIYIVFMCLVVMQTGFGSQVYKDIFMLWLYVVNG